MENQLESKLKSQIRLNIELVGFLEHQSSNTILQWFQSFCNRLSRTILLVSKYNRAVKLIEDDKNTLMLYMWQLVTILAHLINVFVNESEVKTILYESRSYIKKQLTTCLEGIQQLVIERVSPAHEVLNFVKLMDVALDKISDVAQDVEQKRLLDGIREAKTLCEEVLCHAMSIAQVALAEDYKIIKGSAQTVLEVLDLVSNEASKKTTNPAMTRLYLDSSSDKLCSLERKVNTAVLKLCLQVFSEYTDALCSIDEFCSNENNKDNVDQLDSLIVDFDLHVDRIMQIGLFAASCTNKAIKMRSCLASLEALETELVPAFTASLVTSCERNRRHAFLLRLHWTQQANLLKEHVYSIIDPFAFCQVVYLNMKQNTEDISSEIKDKHDISDKVEKIIKQADVLREFLKTLSAKNTQSLCDDFSKVLHELKVSKKTLLGPDNDKLENKLRILKRCKILASQVKTLWLCFFEDDTENQQGNLPGFALDNDKPETGNHFLDHIITKGATILKERSILYKTPIKCESSQNWSLSVKKTPIQSIRNRSLRKVCFINALKRSYSLDLDVTDILNELTNVTSSLVK